MFFVFCLFYILQLNLGVDAAAFLLPPQTKPAKYACEQGCFVPDLDKVLAYNSTYSPQDGKSCIKYDCGTDGWTGGYTCGVIGVGDGCTIVKGNLYLPYPDCCDYPKCEVPPTTENPEPTTVTPEPTTEKPKPTTVKPKPTTEKPKPTTVKPKPTTEKPKPTTVKPKPTTEKPKPTTVKPKPTTVKPKPTTVKPQPTTEKPKPTTVKPEPTTDKPKPITIKPKPPIVTPGPCYPPPRYLEDNGEVGTKETLIRRPICPVVDPPYTISPIEREGGNVEEAASVEKPTVATAESTGETNSFENVTSKCPPGHACIDPPPTPKPEEM